MKRSQDVVRASMRKNWQPITVALTGFALTACGSNEQEAVIYQNLDECTTSNPENSQACESAYEHALQESSRTAPKYRSQNECEAEFGYNACVQPQNSGFFMPMMTGFMFGQMMNNNYYSQPMYRSTYPGSSFYNRWASADGRDYGRNARVRVNRDQMKPKATVNRTISRGGFGSTVSAKSSWGGGNKSWGG